MKIKSFLRLFVVLITMQGYLLLIVLLVFWGFGLSGCLGVLFGNLVLFFNRIIFQKNKQIWVYFLYFYMLLRVVDCSCCFIELKLFVCVVIGNKRFIVFDWCYIFI